MTENAKKVIELLKNDEKLLERAKSAKTFEELITIAKEKGLNLSKEDLGLTTKKCDFLNGKTKLNLDELEKVSGGEEKMTCFCSIAGGGKGIKFKYTCGCVAYGQGNDEWGTTCRCPIGGVGYDCGYGYGC